MYVIDREGKLFLRVKDRRSEVLRTFTGIDRFPVDVRWRVRARLEGGPTTIRVPDVLGNEAESPSPGVLVFSLDDREYRLTPTGEPGETMFLVFGDASNGTTTYAGGRFLVIINKLSVTPQRYPRRAGVPSKRTLRMMSQREALG